MNIEKLARYLKEFTLDEIETIAECDCRKELEHMQNTNKIVFEQGVFKIASEKPKESFELFMLKAKKRQQIEVENAVEYFMEKYVRKHCKLETYRNYNSIFNFNIVPFLKGKFLHEIDTKDIKEVYRMCKLRHLKPRRIKNTLALLNQLLKYFQNLGYIDKTCSFQVKRLTAKNEFSLNRVVFE